MRVFLAALALLVSACATTPSAPAALISTDVRDGGLVATYYRPETERRLPGIVVLGGSEGGIEGAQKLAQPLAEEGYATLAVAFFGTAGLPQNLQDVPLGYFDRAIDWLRAQPGIDRRRIAILGASKGGEAVLLVASRRNDLAAVVAGVPSDVAWQGINRQDRTPRSSWTDASGPVAYVPFDRSVPFTTIYDLYQRSRGPYGDEGAAIIPVERISAPLLLIAGENDNLWPSADMTRRMARRLDAAHFRHRFTHVEFPNAGHGIIGRPLPPNRAEELNELGGTTQGNATARAESWRMILEFLDRSLR